MRLAAVSRVRPGPETVLARSVWRVARRRACLGLVLACVTALGLEAQGSKPTTGAIEGVVARESGEGLARVRVRLSGDIERSLSTDKRGYYRIDRLPPGLYSIEVAADGFVTSLRDGMRLRAAETLRLDFALAEGSRSSFTMTSQPVVDWLSADSGFRLTFEDLGRLPTGGVLLDLASLLPFAESVFLDEGEIEPLAAVPGLGLGGLPVEDFASVFVIGSDPDTAVRSPDRLHMTSRTPLGARFGERPGAIHGSLRTRIVEDRLLGRRRLGVEEERDAWRPTAAIGAPLPALIPSASHLFASYARHDDRRLFLPEDGVVGLGAIEEGLEREVDLEQETAHVRAELAPNPGLRLRPTFLAMDTEEEERVGERRMSGDFAPSTRSHTMARSAISVDRIGTRTFGFSLLLAEQRDRLLDARARTSTGGFVEFPRLDLERTEGSWRGRFSRSRHLVTIGAGWVEHEETGRDAFPLRGDSYGLSVHERWMATPRVAVHLALRTERVEREVGTTRRTIDFGDLLLPRASVSWDVQGDGQWSLRATAGRRHRVGPQLPFTSTKDWLEPQLEEQTFYALGSRYQFLPGLLLEGELTRIELDEPSVQPVLELLESWPLDTTPAVEETRLRVNAELRISTRWNAWAFYEARDPDTGGVLSAFGLPGHSSQHLRLTSWMRFDNGFGLGGVFRYLDGYDVTTPLVGSVVEVDSVGRGDAQEVANLAQADLSVEFRRRIEVRGLEDGLDVTFRLDAQNLLDRKGTPVSLSLPGDEGRFLLRSQDRRRLWLGMSVSF